MDKRQTIRLLLGCGVVGPLLFILVFLIEGATRPGYNVWRNFVSQLSLSDQGWMQVINFIVCGTLVLCFALGLRRVLHHGPSATLGPALLAVFGLSLIIAGIFVTDPALGYPAAAAARSTQTLHGTLHGLAGLLAFTSLPAACFALARRFARAPHERGWAVYSAITGTLLLVLFIAFTTTSSLDEHGILPNAPTGVLQRIAIMLGWGWIILLALRQLAAVRDEQRKV